MAEQLVEQTRFVEQPEVIVVSSLPEDRLAHKKARELIRSAGSLALVGARPETTEESKRPTNLLETINLAATGDQPAIQLLDQTITTDYIERSFKAGSITKVELHADDQNSLGQYGQSLDDVNANSWRFTGRTWQMREVKKVEARNKFRQDMARQSGALKDNYFAVFSLVPDNMTFEELEDDDFFVETMSLSVQATTEEDDGISLETAFAAGVKEPRGERYDLRAIQYLAKKLGQDFSGKSTLEILDTPLLIPKHLMPNGVVDLVKLLDEPEGTFFGEDKPQEDYIERRDFWRERQKKLKPMAENIRKQLIAERHAFKKPTDATERLGKLSEKEGVHGAVDDLSIDPRVFGPEAAGHIEQARIHQALGNYELANAALGKAEETATSSSCPGAIQDDMNKAEQDAEDAIERANDLADSWHGGKVKKGRCVNCKEITKVGVKSWCEPCITGHCGGKKAA